MKTGFLPDAAEEYWPKLLSNEKPGFISNVNHLPIRDGKGFITIGGSLREVYELFDDYLWGKGVQDGNGYFLHRILLHSDFRYNAHFRFFGELESSLISGRAGGPRPVQDLNKMAVEQLFAEYSGSLNSTTHCSFRVGEQALNYGVGSLLDIRGVNVRRTFEGVKFIIEHKNTKVDIFAMELMKTSPGFFDDKVDPSQKIAGAWLTKSYPNKILRRIDAYYIYIYRNPSRSVLGSGLEKRNTLGAALNFTKSNWSSYTEATIQQGTFNDEKVLAWKFAEAVTYQIRDKRLQPSFSIQSAISSGDNNIQKNGLQTFNPIYPKAIYYGFIDNVGAANIFLVHTKTEISPANKLRLACNYYRFWRESLSDGIYAPSGLLFLASNNKSRLVGDMVDLVTSITQSTHLSFNITLAYYKRGPFLKQEPTTNHDIRYLGMSATIRF